MDITSITSSNSQQSSRLLLNSALEATGIDEETASAEEGEAAKKGASLIHLERQQQQHQLPHQRESSHLHFAGLLLTLPANLFNIILISLTSSELLNLMRSCKQMHTKIFREGLLAISVMAIRLFTLSSDLEFYVDYGDEPAYLASRAQRNHLIAARMSTNATPLINHMRSYSLLKASIQNTPSIASLDKLFSIMNKPSMPTMKIRRENIGMHAHSWFQNTLLDIYCDFMQQSQQQQQQQQLSSMHKTTPFSQFSLSSSTGITNSTSSPSLSLFLGNTSGFIYLDRGMMTPTQDLLRFSYTTAEAQRAITARRSYGEEDGRVKLSTEQENMLDNIRWYAGNFDEVIAINDSAHTASYISENPAVMAVLVTSRILKSQCEYLRDYLIQISSSASCFDLLSEYNLKWQTYQAGIIAVQEQLKDVFCAFNELYKTELSVDVILPEYTAIRMGAQHWARIIVDPLQESLMQSFFLALQTRRLQNLSQVIGVQQSQYQQDDHDGDDVTMVEETPDDMIYFSNHLPQQIESVPVEIQLRYTKCASADLSVVACDENIVDRGSESAAFFMNHKNFVDNLMSTFVENMMDLSLNEVSVHWLGHSQIQLGTLYKDLQEEFLRQTKEYFHRVQTNIFTGYLKQRKANRR